MSTKSELDQDLEEGERVSSSDEVCASCGIAAVDDIKLKDCDGGCDLVKYCSDGCQENHREHHEQDCKKRNEEMHDKQLFTPPDICHHGECPICFLPLSEDVTKSIMMSCCCKIICIGCEYANTKREYEQGLEQRCVYCREPAPSSLEEYDKNIMKRIKKHNDPAAMTQMGKKHDREGDYGKALEYFTKAAELGDVAAHASLGTLYERGLGVEKDMKKAVYHYEKAAIGGHSCARGLLANYELKRGNPDRAAKHHIIGANLGYDTSLKCIKALFVQGIVSKEDYAAALRGHQATLDSTKSAEREKAEEAKRRGYFY